jgi:hypothetical protein
LDFMTRDMLHIVWWIHFSMHYSFIRNKILLDLLIFGCWYLERFMITVDLLQHIKSYAELCALSEFEFNIWRVRSWIHSFH